MIKEEKPKVQFQGVISPAKGEVTPAGKNVRRTTMRAIPTVSKKDVE
jgi:hypothetical protein